MGKVMSSSAAFKAPSKGDWCYTAEYQIYVPDIRVSPTIGDQLVLLRGYQYSVAVVRDGKCIGWSIREVSK